MRPAVLVAALALALAAPRPAAGLDRARRIQAMKGVVLVIALQKKGDKYVPVSRGSGSIVSDSGLILTNNHVVSDTKTGALYDLLAVGLTTSFDKVPRPACLAIPSRAIRDPSLDLAVIRCEAEMSGKPLRRAIEWPSVTVGDSSSLVPGDDMYIVGYPAIGGMTITFSAGKASGFLDEDNVARAWIKTDALISPGVSGGAAFDDEGKLIGVPTQLRWQKGERTNLGMVRPVARVRPLLARVLGKDWGSIPRASAPAPEPGATPTGVRLQLGPVSASGGLDGVAVERSLRERLSAFSACYADALGRDPRISGYMDIRVTIDAGGRISKTTLARTTIGDAPMGRCTAHAVVATRFPAAEGSTEASFVLLFLGGARSPAPTPSPTPPRQPEVPKSPPAQPPPPTTAPDERPRRPGGASYVAGQVKDVTTGHAVLGAAVLIIKPGVRVASLTRSNLSASTATVAFSTSLGYFRTHHALPQGHDYGIVVVAKGYKPLAVDSAVQIMRGAPPVLNLGTVNLRPTGY